MIDRSFRLPEEDYNLLRQAANECGLTIAQLIRVIIRDYCKRYKNKDVDNIISLNL